MQLVKIKLDSVDNIKQLNILASQQKFDIDVTSGRYIVDAKSLLGLFSIDMSKEVVVQIHADENECERFVEALQQYKV